MFYQWLGDVLELQVFVQPKASQCKAQVLGDVVKVYLTAPPINGEANLQLRKFFKKEFNVPLSAIEIYQGELSRHKKVRITGPQQAVRWLNGLIDFSENSL